MTDKQIIIEKGNKKCIFYNDDICRKGDKTRDCMNCARVEYHSLYKLNWENQERLESQLKAKEQECERLRKEKQAEINFGNQYKKQFAEIAEQLNQLKAENERYKPILDRLLQRFETYDKLKSLDVVTFVKQTFEQLDQLKAENNELKDLNIRLDNQRETYWKEYQKLKQTLQEIEKLAIQGNIYCIDYNVDDCEKCIKQNDCKTTLFKQILQKISEVIE